MDKTLEYIKDFYDTSYKTFDINDQQHLKEFSKHLIHLFAFVYCSFSILSKNQLNRVANKRKWKDIYDKITGEFYEYIYVFIIALSKTIKTNWQCQKMWHAYIFTFTYTSLVIRYWQEILAYIFWYFHLFCPSLNF
jgi:hypothetical protein